MNEDGNRLVFMVSNYIQVGVGTQMRTRKFRDQKLLIISTTGSCYSPRAAALKKSFNSTFKLASS